MPVELPPVMDPVSGMVRLFSQIVRSLPAFTCWGCVNVTIIKSLAILQATVPVEVRVSTTEPDVLSLTDG